MRSSDILAVSASVVFGGVTGWVLGGTTGGLVFAAGSGIVALGGVRLGVRPGIMLTVLVGAMTGGLVGSSVVNAICLPATCRGIEIAGGVITAMLSFIGIGLVAALVTRSFDEYYEQAAAGHPPRGVGCETDERDPEQTSGEAERER